MDNTIDEIKSRLDIVSVISEYIQLKPAGTSFKALCPFHREKTPSFFVSPERQIWHCFGSCGKGGSIFDFLMEMEGLEFPEALRILAQKAGVDLKTHDRRSRSKKTKLLDICRLSVKFYHKILFESSLAEEARKYLKQRGLDKKTIQTFELGFAPDKWDTLLTFLKKRGYNENDIEEAGLVLKHEGRRSGYHDRFRNRIMFPIHDLFSQTVGFTSRVLPGTEDEKKLAKYINTPETPIYNKSKILYGLDKAKADIKKQDNVILVEGNMDVIAAHQVGTTNVVCTSGTALTQNHVSLLRRYTENVLLAFDLDLAGQSATDRSIDLLLREGLDVKVIQLEQGKDPDECIRENPRLWKKAITAPLPIMEYYFSLATRGKDLNTIEDKKAITKALLPKIAKLGNPVEAGLWLKKLSAVVDVSEVFLRDALKKSKQIHLKQHGIDLNRREKASPQQQAADRFLALILQYPQKGEEFIHTIVLDMFVLPEAQTLVRAIKDVYNKDKKIEVKKIKKNIAKDRKTTNYINFLFFLSEKEYENYTADDVYKELSRLFMVLKKHYITQKMEKLVGQLKQAEEQKDEDTIKKISTQIVRLSQELAK
ncbi:DNA primase [Patescibacteria group bacterium AH-259-L07]|nr:DNA primase [Patescibacteria group bacterium AH-259-L07]